MRRAMTLAIAALLGSCAAPRVGPEPLRIENWDDLSQEQLGFVKGQTGFAEAVEALRRRGLTGIAQDTFVGADSRVISVLTADYQSRVHAFENGRYRGSTSVHSEGLLPYGFALHTAASTDGLVVLALYRDPVEATSGAVRAREPRLSLLIERPDGFALLRTIPLGALVAEHGGLQRPLFVGRDLDEGLMFLGRDREGAVWSTAYLLSIRHGQLGLATLPIEAAARCACVRDYLQGEPVDDAPPD